MDFSTSILKYCHLRPHISTHQRPNRGIGTTNDEQWRDSKRTARAGDVEASQSLLSHIECQDDLANKACQDWDRKVLW